VATVGALSSNWDRALELYYQIKGGQVDYGAAHSEAYGHLQRPPGKVYADPLYPEWDADHPVHLVGHSMGGQTIRMLAAIMHGGEPHYRNVLLDAQGRPFTPGDGWIRSVTTLSSPHCGASLFDVRDNSLSISLGILALAGLEAIDIIPDSVYNFDLEHWQLQPGAQESLFSFLERVDETLGSSLDYSVWELSVSGAERFNALVNLSHMDPGIYFFSYATCQSVALGRTPYTWPSLAMHPFFINDAITLGLHPDMAGPPGMTDGWRRNDGVVNTPSMHYPAIGCGDTWDNATRPGCWLPLGELRWDHFDILGQLQDRPEQWQRFVQFYLDLAARLCSLPDRFE